MFLSKAAFSRAVFPYGGTVISKPTSPYLLGDRMAMVALISLNLKQRDMEQKVPVESVTYRAVSIQSSMTLSSHNLRFLWLTFYLNTKPKCRQSTWLNVQHVDCTSQCLSEERQQQIHMCVAYACHSVKIRSVSFRKSGLCRVDGAHHSKPLAGMCNMLRSGSLRTQWLLMKSSLMARFIAFEFGYTIHQCTNLNPL